MMRCEIEARRAAEQATMELSQGRAGPSGRVASREGRRIIKAYASRDM